MHLSQLQQTAKLIRPPPRLKISEWAEAEAYLPSDGNAEPGKYRGARMPWQRDMLDDPLDTAVEEIAWMLASQMGKTLCLIIIIMYFIIHQPTKILMIYPKLDDVKDWMRDKFIPTTRDTPCMEGRLKEPRQRDSESRQLNRKFPGGGLVGVGSISTSSLRRVSARVVVQDEIDDFETTPQGDSMALADKRAETFHNAVKLKSSTPTHKGTSRIEAKWEASDQQRFFVPCQKCGHLQHLRWIQFKFSREIDGKKIYDIENATYECEAEACKAQWTDQERIAAIFDLRAEWRATAPQSKIRGRHLNGLYRVIGKKSAFKSYHHEFAAGFLEAKKSRETIMVWVNTFLAEPFADPSKEIDWHPLMDRAEDYGPELPDEVCLLLGSVDIHGDFASIKVGGFGDEEEFWWIDSYVIFGDFDQPEMQLRLDDYLATRWTHPSGASIPITAVTIDSGHKTKAVYRYCRGRVARNVWAVKGSSTAYAPMVTPSKKAHYGIRLWTVGTDTAKESIFSRLEIAEPGPRYIHFPKAEIERDGKKVRTGFDEKFYRELCSEKIVETFVRGVHKRQFVKTQARNEAIDNFVYLLACYDILRPNMPALRRNVIPTGGPGGGSAPKDYQLKDSTLPEKALTAPLKPKTNRPPRPKHSGGFFNPLGL